MAETQKTSKRAPAKRSTPRTVKSAKRTTSTKTAPPRDTAETAPTKPQRDTSPVGKYREAASAAVEAARKVETAAEELRTASLEANKRIGEAVGRYNQLSGHPSKNGVGRSVRRYLATRIGSLTGANADRAVPSLVEALETGLAVDPQDEALLRKRNPE